MIKFNSPHQVLSFSKSELAAAMEIENLAGDGPFNSKVRYKLEQILKSQLAFLTPSCTAALELAALVLDIKTGDEVILPSNTFVSTANAFVLRGATPVFVDCDPRTLNMCPMQVEAAITDNTKCIVPVHYAGVSCAMSELTSLTENKNIFIVEDAAQAIGSKYGGKPVGTFGNVSTFSFHNTKNIVCGEGGAFILNDKRLVPSAEILREKGTDRSRFMNGEVDKYSWVSVGSSFLLSELCAATISGQLTNLRKITSYRLNLWHRYYSALKLLEDRELLKLPYVPDNCEHNGHMFFVILNDKIDRQSVIKKMAEKGVKVVSHYVPLHSSPGGLKYGRFTSNMEVTNRISQKLIRLPMYYGLSENDQAQVIECLVDTMEACIV